MCTRPDRNISLSIRLTLGFPGCLGHSKFAFSKHGFHRSKFPGKANALSNQLVVVVIDHHNVECKNALIIVTRV